MKPPPMGLVPAIAKAAPKPRVDIPAAIRATINQLEETLGGRGQLIAVLAQNASTTAIVRLLADLATPEHDGKSLATLCQMNGLTTGDVLRAYQDGMKLYAQTLAVREIAQQEVAVTRDVMARALPIEVECPTCDGTTKVWEAHETGKGGSLVDCTRCKHTGRIIQVPDLERQKVALDLAELLPKKGGFAIGIQQSTHLHAPAAGGFGGTLEKLQQSVSGILYGSDEDPIDVEAVEVLDSPEGRGDS